MKRKQFFTLLLLFVSYGITAQNNVYSKSDNGMITCTPAWYESFKNGQTPASIKTEGAFNFNNYCSYLVQHPPLLGSNYIANENIPLGRYTYELGDDGFIKKQTMVNFSEPFDSIVSTLNQTFIMDGFDMTDTAVLYTKEYGYEPVSRIYYSYHFFDHYEQDSFFFERIHQYWNGIQWMNYFKERWAFLNPSGHIREMLNIYADEQGQWAYISLSSYDSLLFDDKGNVKYKITKELLSPEGASEERYKYEYFYHTDGGPYYERIGYRKVNDGWEIMDKMSNIEWKEWNGFMDNVNHLMMTADLYDHQFYFATMSKPSYYEYYSYPQETWKLKFLKKKFWHEDGTKTVLDTTYVRETNSEGESIDIPDQTFNTYYDECGSFTEWNSTIFDYDPEQGLSVAEFTSTWHDIVYGEYGKEKDFIYVINSSNKNDTSFFSGTTIDQFGPASIPEQMQQKKHLLDIIPNPATNYAKIIATKPICRIDIFDLTGRLISTQQVSNSKEQLLNLTSHNSGIYIIKAMLKDGSMQIGKLVLR